MLELADLLKEPDPYGTWSFDTKVGEPFILNANFPSDLEKVILQIGSVISFDNSDLQNLGEPIQGIVYRIEEDRVFALNPYRACGRFFSAHPEHVTAIGSRITKSQYTLVICDADPPFPAFNYNGKGLLSDAANDDPGKKKLNNSLMN